MKEQRRRQGGASSSDTARGEDGMTDCSADCADPDADADALAARLAGDHHDEGCDDVRVEPVSLLRDDRPAPGVDVLEVSADGGWDARDTEERLSAAGAAAPAKDRVIGVGDEDSGRPCRERPFGVVFNPKNYPWQDEACNVHWREEARLKALRDQWCMLEMGRIV